MKELRLANICDMAAGNAFLAEFMTRFNAKFATAPARSNNAHRALNMAPDRLADVLCWREKRHVSRQLILSYERDRIILAANELTRGLADKYVDIYKFADGRLEVRWKGMSLPYHSFDKDQRVTHASIVENKRLSEALTFVKRLQEKRQKPITVKTNSERIGYQRTGRKPRDRSAVGSRTPIVAN